MNPASEPNRRLKAAVHSVEVPPYLEAKIRARLREPERQSWWSAMKLAPVAAVAAVCLGAGIAYQLGHLRLTTASQESYVVSVSNQIATLMRVGLGDHIHCSVFRKYPKNPPTTEEFAQKLGPDYAGLIPIVREQVPENYGMTLAHQCTYNKRKFVHLSFKNDSNMLSLLITRKGSGESFRTEDMLPALMQAGIPMYQAGAQRFQMTAFETRDYLVYFVSDLGKDGNTNLMVALGPKLNDYLRKLEL